ncbi:MAG TPA: Hpt domain-containing protein [Terracidiphilus sp.]|jgi:HPt (histidine-containing phosphotransfer) domain-containing protein
MGTTGQPALAEALKLLWVRFLPQMQERVAALEAANHALQAGVLSGEQRQEAAAAAHKLAGVLGTFGLITGTELAREAEQIYANEAAIAQTAVVRLSAIAKTLMTTIQSHS